MPTVSTDIQLRRSGAACLGGAKSATLAGANYFDDATDPEAVAGDVEYRCLYVHNAHATKTLTGAVAWLSANTPSGSTVLEISVGSSAINGTEQTIASEQTAPAGVTFVMASTVDGGVALGDIPPGQHRAIWLRRTLAAGAPALKPDTFTVRVDGNL
jgi:hypothetical protein